MSNQFPDIPFDSREVEEILRMDCEFLDEDLNDIPFDNFQEDHENQEHQTRPEETGVQSDIDADSQGPEVEHDDQTERRRKRPQLNKNGN